MSQVQRYIHRISCQEELLCVMQQFVPRHIFGTVILPSCNGHAVGVINAALQRTQPWACNIVNLAMHTMIRWLAARGDCVPKTRRLYSVVIVGFPGSNT